MADLDDPKVKPLHDRIYEWASSTPKPIPIKDIQDTFRLDDGTFREALDIFTNSHVFDVRDNRIVSVRPPNGLLRYDSVEMLKVIEERRFAWHSLNFHVRIVTVPGQTVPIYYLPALKIGDGLKARLKSLFMSLSRGQVGKKSADYEGQPDSLRHIAAATIDREMKTRPELTERLADVMVYEFAEAGCLNVFLADRDIEEIVFNGGSEASLYSNRYGWLKTNVVPSSEESLVEIASRMVRLTQKEINFNNPIVETRLESGDRVNALLSEVSPRGTIITIRKFSREPWSIIGLVKELKATTVEVAALLWFAVEYDLNILVAGGSGSGKTTLLNAIANLIPPSVHVLSIETVREIQIPESRAWNWLSLVSRDEPNAATIGTKDLIAISLKMRPERIVFGEAVRPEEIRALFQAMQVGHPVYSTIHATSSKELIRRILDPAYEIPRTDINSLDLVLVMYYDIKSKSRALIELSEISYDGPGSESGIITRLYTYNPSRKAYMQSSKPKKLFDKVALKTGMSEEEMLRDIEEKRKVLQWAADKNVTHMRDFEGIVQEYYSSKGTLMPKIGK
jgi:archaeal flagellar protein FlaI